jgi:general secretion pathway protein J
MNAQRRRKAVRPGGTAGFSLVEALASLALTAIIVSSLAAVTGQWLPNWHRGFGRVQRMESLDVGLQRVVADIEAAEFLTPNSVSKAPIFLGNPKSVTLARVSNAPGTSPHLEFVKLAETVDERGFALVRSHAPFKPLDPNRPIDDQLYFADSVVLVRAPFRLSFAFAGSDRIWRDSWRDPVLLPSAARVQVRDAASDEVLAVSTAAVLRADLPAECVTQKSPRKCIDGMRMPPGRQPGAQTVGQPSQPTNGQ